MKTNVVNQVVDGEPGSQNASNLDSNRLEGKNNEENHFEVLSEG